MYDMYDMFQDSIVYELSNPRSFPACHQDVSANMTYAIQTRFGRHISEGIMACGCQPYGFVVNGGRLRRQPWS